MAIHFPSFSGRGSYSSNPKSYCGPKAFRAYGSNDGSNPLLGKREVRKARRVLDTRLVVSSYPSHTATELCQSDTSRGPDFISVAEGLFCDMETRQVLQLCADGVNTSCVHMPGNSTMALVRRDGFATEKSYSAVVRWDQEA
jgi:hypothetical protein